MAFKTLFEKGIADKILDFFLRRKRVLAKYTKEEKQKAEITTLWFRSET